MQKKHPTEDYPVKLVDPNSHPELARLARESHAIHGAFCNIYLEEVWDRLEGKSVSGRVVAICKEADQMILAYRMCSKDPRLSELANAAPEAAPDMEAAWSWWQPRRIAWLAQYGPNSVISSGHYLVTLWSEHLRMILLELYFADHIGKTKAEAVIAKMEPWIERMEAVSAKIFQEEVKAVGHASN